ncbi:FxSxx-COOH system tetratricopeptide repeat protein [Sphaerisporangium perillae]|uniref:FxSxx-COOH system tetratricopeptide repeat protein n=1 Tax=Sphaerisporangium perillae TaxID=2935860 RepID=UPI00200F88F8|nr:FxSxx-COOH system tetratricopeptide repeat protein [Sphaerisporangium perillae]
MAELSQAAHTVPDRRPEIWERVPPRNRNFTGRDDLLLALRKGINTVTAVVPQPRALHGLGGVGKTQLAIEYAHRYRSHYDLVWWISADQRVLLPSSLAAMAPSLGLPPASATGVDDAAEAVRRALEEGAPYRRWLLVFDNAEDPEHIQGFLPQGPGHVLITSRNPRWENHVETLRVNVFDRDESIAFLEKRLRGQFDRDEANRLAEKLGDLPLALEQAGALQYETGMTVDEYIEQLDAQASRLLNANKASDYPLSMTAAWKVSVSLLEDRLPEAVEVLRCCAFFGPEPIPRDVFRRGKSARAPRLGPILSDPILLSKALLELGRFALARIDSSTRTVQVHRLIQVLLRDELTDEAKDELSHEVHLLLAGSAPPDPDKIDRWREFEELVTHIGPSRLAGCEDPGVRAFALNIVRYLYQAGNYRSALSFVTGFIEQWTEISGPGHMDVLVAQKHLGNILRRLGEYAEAYKVDHATRERMLQVLGADHSETLWITNGYGADLRARGQFLQARELDLRSREAHTRLFGAIAPSTLRVMNSLALDYALTSDYTRARELHQETYVEQRDAEEGVGKTSVLMSWNGLARAVRLCGDYAEACDLGEEVYAFGMRELSLDHPSTLLAAKDLSIARRRRGMLTEALELARETHGRFMRLFGPGNPDTMAAAIDLSNTLRTCGRLEEALELAEETVPRYPKVFGDHHPYVYGCNVNLALLYRLTGDAAAARALNEKALEGLADTVSRNHDYSLTCAVNLATDLAALGEVGEARRLGEDSLARLTRLFGEGHFMTMACRSNLALDLIADGAVEEGEALRRLTLERYGEDLRLGHPDAELASAGRRIDFDFDPPPI